MNKFLYFSDLNECLVIKEVSVFTMNTASPPIVVLSSAKLTAITKG